jgi:hypothetical protein
VATLVPLDVGYPFATGPGSNTGEAGWRGFYRNIISSGVLGLEDNEFQVIGDSTGLHVKVDTGKAFAEGHFMQSSGQKTVDLATPMPTGTNKRIDLVVARCRFSPSDLVELEVVAGVPTTGTPVAPTPTQNDTTMWEIPLATVGSVAAPLVTGTVTIAAGNVFDARQYSFTKDNSPWLPWTPVVGGAWTRNNGTVSGRYKKTSRGVKVKGNYVVGNLDGAGAGLTIAGLPFAPVNLRARGRLTINDVSAGSDWPGLCKVAVGSTTLNLVSQAVFAAPGGVFYTTIDANTPFTWGAGDIFDFEIEYETAT